MKYIIEFREARAFNDCYFLCTVVVVSIFSDSRMHCTIMVWILVLVRLHKQTKLPSIRLCTKGNHKLFVELLLLNNTEIKNEITKNNEAQQTIEIEWPLPFTCRLPTSLRQYIQKNANTIRNKILILLKCAATNDKNVMS